MKIMAGIDLHSNNAMVGLVDMEGRRLVHKRVGCELTKLLDVLRPYQERIDTIAVESTFNWYWLVDGLQAANYRVVLANPARIDQYDGLKHADDKSDAYFLAELLRLGIMPTGYIYDKELRPVRDLLRRRLGLVRKRTSLILSFKSLYARTTGGTLSLARVKSMDVAEAAEMYTHPADQLIAGEQMKLMGQFEQSIGLIERAVLKVAQHLPCYERLQSLPGIGKILGLTITMEIGDLKRFPSAGDYASYCRCVQSRRTSNDKNKGRNNGKCGNKYLAWAYVEAANCAKRYNPACRQFVDRKTSQTNGIVATKALACKLSKASWHVIKDNVEFDLSRLFPGMKTSE